MHFTAPPTTGRSRLTSAADSSALRSVVEHPVRVRVSGLPAVRRSAQDALLILSQCDTRLGVDEIVDRATNGASRGFCVFQRNSSIRVVARSFGRVGAGAETNISTNCQNNALTDASTKRKEIQFLTVETRRQVVPRDAVTKRTITHGGTDSVRRWRSNAIRTERVEQRGFTELTLIMVD